MVVQTPFGVRIFLLLHVLPMKSFTVGFRNENGLHAKLLFGALSDVGRFFFNFAPIRSFLWTTKIGKHLQAERRNVLIHMFQVEDPRAVAPNTFNFTMEVYIWTKIKRSKYANGGLSLIRSRRRQITPKTWVRTTFCLQNIQFLPCAKNWGLNEWMYRVDGFFYYQY